jgi:hypothetical protein
MQQVLVHTAIDPGRPAGLAHGCGVGNLVAALSSNIANVA